MFVEYKKRFEKTFKLLSPKVKERFSERLKLYLKDTSDPILNNHSVGMVYPDCRSINITGDYRAIFYEEGNVVTFVSIGTHAQLYK